MKHTQIHIRLADDIVYMCYIKNKIKNYKYKFDVFLQSKICYVHYLEGIVTYHKQKEKSSQEIFREFILKRPKAYDRQKYSVDIVLAQKIF